MMFDDKECKAIQLYSNLRNTYFFIYFLIYFCFTYFGFSLSPSCCVLFVVLCVVCCFVFIVLVIVNCFCYCALFLSLCSLLLLMFI
jgi:hypothetical protein